MTAIIDYGVGNLFSLTGSLGAVGARVLVTANPGDLKKARRLILPGVGAFGEAREKLRASGLEEALLEEVSKGKPLLGICLGMQMLFDKSFEYGEHPGLGLIRGHVSPLRPLLPPQLKIPQIGWNSLHFPEDRPRIPLFRYTPEGTYVYFVHSFAGMDCADSLAAVTHYGLAVTAAVAKDNVYGCQFHPEKSGAAGLRILRAFCEL